MPEYTWLLAGGAAVTGLVTAGWQYLRTAYMWARSWIFITAELQEWQGQIFISYLTEHFQRTNYGHKNFLTWWMNLPRRRRVLPVLFSVPPSNGTLYWKGWRPIWVHRKGSAQSPRLSGDGGTTGDNATRDIGATITIIRGTFDIEKMMVDSVANLKIAGGGKSRYHVRRLFGQRGMYISKDRSEGEHSGPRVTRGGAPASIVETLPGQPLNYEIEDVRPIPLADRAGFRGLVFDDKTEELADFVKGWLQEEAWYHEHMIPWKVGIGLHGQPGCGKTSFARALGEELDLPIYAIALTTCTDEDFEVHWEYAVGNGPCIVLLEDIDNAYNGRTPHHEDQVGFDLLLNCIDGAATSDGIVVIITTNCVDKLDPALIRPGRIDRMVELKPPTDKNRRILCERFLGEHADLLDRVDKHLAGQTGATIVQYCSRLALQLKWGHPIDLQTLQPATSPEAEPIPMKVDLAKAIDRVKQDAQEDLARLVAQRKTDPCPMIHPHNATGSAYEGNHANAHICHNDLQRDSQGRTGSVAVGVFEDANCG